MSFNQNRVSTFDKGTITRFKEESIPEGSASESNNFITLGDRIEIISGTKTLGDTQGSSPVSSYYVGVDLLDRVQHYKKVDTTLYHYNEATDEWDSILTDLPEEDLYGTVYRSPAGSFLVLSSKDSGLYRINLINPTDVVDLYDENRNFQGVPLIKNSRMLMWDTGRTGFQQGAKGILRLSKIDNDFPYTDVSNESLSGDTGTLLNGLIQANSLAITDGTETLVDNSTGVLNGDQGGTGTINYTTGEYSITWGAGSASGSITADYAYEQPTDNGIFDFRYSPTRLAGQGAFFFQGENNTEIQGIAAIDENWYVLHDRAIWFINLPADDLNPTNKVYRVNTGCATKRAYVESGDGIYYLDATNDSPAIRLLRYDRAGIRLIPTEISTQLDLTQYNPDDCAMTQFGDLILVALKEKGFDYNNVVLIYNRELKLYDIYRIPVRWFAEAKGQLFGASSLNSEVFRIFDTAGFDEANINASWVSNDSFDETLELKRHRYFVLEGDLAQTQEIIVEASYDEGSFTEIGRIKGDDPQIVSTQRQVYGGGVYGVGIYGQGSPGTVAGYFMREFKISSPKYFRKKIRFRSNGFGYLSVRAYTTKDIRNLRARIPSRFR